MINNMINRVLVSVLTAAMISTVMPGMGVTVRGESLPADGILTDSLKSSESPEVSTGSEISVGSEVPEELRGTGDEAPGSFLLGR